MVSFCYDSRSNQAAAGGSNNEIIIPGPEIAHGLFKLGRGIVVGSIMGC